MNKKSRYFLCIFIQLIRKNIKNHFKTFCLQFFGGAFQTTGWPSVVTIMANWFGKGKKGLIFGIWNSHTAVGNILGSFLAGL